MASTTTRKPQVAILLCTCNGGRFLAEQLQSYKQQTNTNWRVFASDDGSEDNTLSILGQFSETHGPGYVEVRGGPRRGFIANFLSLVCDRSIEADYYAYSDQDDIWEADKLDRAIGWLRTLSAGTPGLYCSRTRIVDTDGMEIGLSPLFVKAPGIRNALVQNIAGGNTMVFNGAARRVLQSGGSDVQIPAHDWWTYLVVSATGGKVKYDPHPSIRYRSHTENLIGSNQGTAARVKRLQMLATGRFREWTDMNISALERLRPQMCQEALAVFNAFCQAREQTLMHRPIGFIRSGVYRQTIPGNIALSIAVFLNKI